MTHCNLVHKFISMPQAMKIPDAKAAVDKEWKKVETVLAWQLGKVKSKKDDILGAQSDEKKVHFATLISEVQGSSRAPRRRREDDSVSRAVFTEQCSPDSQVTVA